MFREGRASHISAEGLGNLVCWVAMCVPERHPRVGVVSVPMAVAIIQHFMGLGNV